MLRTCQVICRFVVAFKLSHLELLALLQLFSIKIQVSSHKMIERNGGCNSLVKASDLGKVVLNSKAQVVKTFCNRCIQWVLSYPAYYHAYVPQDCKIFSCSC